MNLKYCVVLALLSVTYSEADHQASIDAIIGNLDGYDRLVKYFRGRDRQNHGPPQQSSIFDLFLPMDRMCTLPAYDPMIDEYSCQDPTYEIPAYDSNENICESGEIDPSSVLCAQCSPLAEGLLAYQLVFEPSREDFVGVAANICIQLGFGEPEFCDGMVEEFYWEVQTVALKLYADYDNITTVAAEICGYTLGCPFNRTEKWNWDIDISRIPPTCVNECKSNAMTVHPFIVDVATDLHVQQNYSVGADANCDFPNCCRPVDEPGPNYVAAGEYGSSTGNCDTPWKAFESLIQSILNCKTCADIFVLPGDIAEHIYWLLTLDEINTRIEDVLRYIKREFSKICPNTQLFYILGNHDVHPLNQASQINPINPTYDPSNVSITSTSNSYIHLAEVLAILWGYDDYEDIPDAQLKTILCGGYYTRLIKPGLRIVGMNSVPFSTYNFWVPYNPSMNRDQFQWLVDTLEQALEDGEKVILTTHFPGTELSVDDKCKEVMQDIHNAYPDVIVLTLTGHTHRSEIELGFAPDNDTCLNYFNLNAGSGTAWTDNDESIKWLTRPNSIVERF